MRTMAAARLADALSDALHENSKYTPATLRRARPGALATPLAPAPAMALPPVPARLGISVQDAVLRRRSVRRYAERDMPLDRLAAFLRLGTAPELCEREELAGGPPLAGSVALYLFLWGAAGVAPGTYRYDRARHALAALDVGHPTREEICASLFQKEFAGGTGLLLITGDLAAAVAAYGPRGYRYLLMQAGLMGESFYLAGAALRIGVSGNGGLRETTVQRHCRLDGVERDLLWSLAFGLEEPEARP